MTSVTINKQMDVNQNQTVFNCEVTNGYTLETQFGEIIGVTATNEESGVGAGTYFGYTIGTGVATGQITCYVNTVGTWTITVSGRK